jgi:GT2 family glycosyltransferase
LQYHHNPANPGFGAGHNAAFCRAVGADFFLVANPDLAFAPEALVAGLEFFSAHPQSGVLAPLLVDADDLRPACFRPPDLLTLALRACGLTARHSRRIARYECRDWDVRQAMFDPPLLSGCCLLFRASAYRKLGGFDPRYFLYFEDFDLTLRANQLGLSAYCPAMRVAHAGGGASRKGLRHQMHFMRSAWRFFAAHGWRGW